MLATLIEYQDFLKPMIRYSTLRDLMPLNESKSTEYPDPLIIFARLSDFTVKPEARNRRHCSIQRHSAAKNLDLEKNLELREFKRFVQANQDYEQNLDIIKLFADAYDDILIAFRSCSTGDADVRELQLISDEIGYDEKKARLVTSKAKFIEQKFAFPIIWNAAIPNKLLSKDSFIPHIDFYHRGRYYGQVVKSPGDYVRWTDLQKSLR